MVARSPNESSSRGIGPCRAGTGLEESAMTTNRSAAPATIFSLVCAPPPPLTSQPSGATWSAPSMVRSNRSMLATSSIRRPSSRAACSVRGDVAAHTISSDLLARAGSRYATVEPVPSPTVMPFSTSSAAASAATCFSRSVFIAACLPGSAWKLSAAGCPPVNLARIRVVAYPDALVLDWASAVLDTEVAAMTCVARVAGATLPVAELLGYDLAERTGYGLVLTADWDCAGVGPPGIDLGSLRCDAAWCHGGEAAGHVLRGWEAEAGRPASDVAYWAAVAALASPPDM